MEFQKSIDSLSQDILDESFVKVFQPTHFILYIFGLLGVNLQYKFVTPPSPGYQVYSCLVRVIDFLTLINYVLDCEIIFSGTFTGVFLKTGTVMIKLGNAIVAWRSMFLYGQLNSQFYVKMQKIDRVLFSRKTHVNRKLSERIFVITTIAVFLYILSMVSYVMSISKADCSKIWFTVDYIIGLGFYAEVVLSVITMYYIGIRVVFLNNILRKEANEAESKGRLYQVFWLEAETSYCNTKFSERLVHSVYCILDVMTDWLTLNQFTILYYMGVVLGTNLIVFQSFVTALKEQKGEYRSTLYLTPLFLYTAVQVFLGVIGGSVTNNLKTTSKMCRRIVHFHPEGKAKDVAKRMTILLDARRDMNVYNIFTLSSGLPVSLLGVVASYAIVQFQFALL